MRKPLPRKADAPAEAPIAGVGASPTVNLAFPQMIAAYDARHDPRMPILSPEEKKVFVDTFSRPALPAASTGTAICTRNWQRSAGLDHTRPKCRR